MYICRGLPGTNRGGNTHLRQPHSTPSFTKLSPLWGGAGFYFGFTPYLLSVSTCFCKCISLFESSLYHSASTSIGSLPSNSPLEVLSQLSKPTTCVWIHLYVRSGTYQHSMHEVLSSDHLKKDFSAEKHAPYLLFEPTTMDKTRFSGTTGMN